MSKKVTVEEAREYVTRGHLPLYDPSEPNQEDWLDCADALLEEVDRLRAWKAEALEVSRQWEEAWVTAGRPGTIGRPKSEGMIAHVKALTAALERMSEDKVRERLAKVLDAQEAMHCTRVWEAWGVGTMGADDFVPVTEDEAALQEIVDAALGREATA